MKGRPMAERKLSNQSPNDYLEFTLELQAGETLYLVTPGGSRRITNQGELEKETSQALRSYKPSRLKFVARK
jgi:hypothetical protein